jgi:type I restriction enzyme M protein
MSTSPTTERLGVRDEITMMARALLMERFPYYVFLYDAERVGITATGDQDIKELFPNPNQPVDSEGATALEVYHDFRQDPTKYVLQPEGANA